MFPRFVTWRVFCTLARLLFHREASPHSVTAAYCTQLKTMSKLSWCEKSGIRHSVSDQFETLFLPSWAGSYPPEQAAHCLCTWTAVYQSEPAWQGGCVNTLKASLWFTQSCIFGCACTRTQPIWIDKEDTLLMYCSWTWKFVVSRQQNKNTGTLTAVFPLVTIHLCLYQS